MLKMIRNRARRQTSAYRQHGSTRGRPGDVPFWALGKAMWRVDQEQSSLSKSHTCPAKRLPCPVFVGPSDQQAARIPSSSEPARSRGCFLQHLPCSPEKRNHPRHSKNPSTLAHQTDLQNRMEKPLTIVFSEAVVCR